MHRKLSKKLCHANIETRSNFVLSKERSWVIVVTRNFFLGGHSLGHAQEALQMCWKACTSEILKWVKFLCCLKMGHGP